MNAGGRAVAWERTKITPAEVGLVHSVGLKLFVWTVNSPLEIRFENQGSWPTLQLLCATNFAGPFLIVAGLTPTGLGGGQYRFDYPLTGSGPEYFRIAGD